MKIAQVVGVFPPYKGGTGNVAANLSLYLTELGHEVTVFTPRYGDDGQKCESNAPYNIEWLEPALQSGNAALVPQLLSRLNDFDVVDLHVPFIGGAGLVVLAKKLKRQKFKLVIHYHMDLFGNSFSRKLFFGVQNQLFTLMELRSASKVIVSSMDYLSRSIIAKLYRSDPGHFAVIPFGVDTKRFFPNKKKPSLLSSCGISDEKVILFVGGLDEAHYFKGAGYLIEACARLIKEGDSVRLILVGRGNLVASYKAKARELGIAGAVFFAEDVKDNELVDYYNLADVFVLPSINSGEAFGLVLLEAMACGVPVVATDLPGVREVVEYGKIGMLAKPADEQDLAKKIGAIIYDKEKHAELSAAGLLSVKNKYNWMSVTRKTVEVYVGNKSVGAA